MKDKHFIQFNKSRQFKLYILFYLLLVVTCLYLFPTNTFVSAQSDEDVDIEEEISSSASEIIDDIDFGELENILSSLDTLTIFDGSIKDKINDILSGEYFTNYSSVFLAIISLIIGDIRGILPFVFTLLAIGILTTLLSEFQHEKSSSGDIVYFVTLSVMIITVIFAFKDILQTTSSTINSIVNQMRIIFPILITMLSSIGSLSSVSIYNPLVAILTTCVSVVFDKILYPIFIVMLIFNILGNITKNIRLDKFQSFLGSVFKWMVGMVFTLFAGFLSIQGISAGKFDGISIKATKFAVKSYIPIIGSYISDGMDFIILGSILVKNTVGLIGIVILFLSIISPIITIVVVKLALSLVSAVLELSGNYRMSNFLSSCSKILIYPIVIIIGVAFMYIMTISLIMYTANII